MLVSISIKVSLQTIQGTRLSVCPMPSHFKITVTVFRRLLFQFKLSDNVSILLPVSSGLCQRHGPNGDSKAWKKLHWCRLKSNISGFFTFPPPPLLEHKCAVSRFYRICVCVYVLGVRGRNTQIPDVRYTVSMPERKLKKT